MKNLYLVLVLCLCHFSLCNAQDSLEVNMTYAVQVISTSMYPYPMEGEIHSVTEVDRLYIEQKEVSGKWYYRYLMKCDSWLEVNQWLVLIRTKFPDAYIVYYKNAKRFN